MQVRKPERPEPTSDQWAQAVEFIQSCYPQMMFGRGDEPVPDDLPTELKDLITAKAFLMARQVCDEIVEHARLLAELPPDVD